MIGILTLYKNSKNFGGLLQAYALQTTLSELGAESEQISYIPSPTPFKQKWKNAAERRTVGRNFKKLVQLIYKRLLALVFGRWCKNLCRIRFLRFTEFEKEIPHSKTDYDIHTIESCNGYDTFITGSDQVWNGSINLKVYSLLFAVDRATCISYAASYGGGIFNSWQKDILRESLNKYNAISVREKGLAAELKKIVDRNIFVALDPIFLVPKKKWEKEVKKVQLTESFVFCYLLGSCRWHRTFAQKIAKNLGCKLVTIPYADNGSFRFSDLAFGDVKDVTSGPREFLWLVQNAKCVITDSFHATAFSILFNKNFWVLPRYKNDDKNGRIADILDDFGLKDRMISYNERKIKSDENIDYSHINKILEIRKKESLDYLRESLGR